MTTTIASTYAKARRAGYGAQSALMAARTVLEFAEAERAGLVRMVCEAEVDNYFDVYGEPEGYTDGHGRRVSAEKERAQMVETLERDGCWIVAAEWFDGCPHCGRGEWETAGSVGMCTGYKNPLDWLENWYVPDLMREALDRISVRA